MNHLSQLPFLPISPALLAEAPFFFSKDPGIVRAGFWMIDAAWRSSQPGSIAGGFEVLACITRLHEDDVAEHYETLTSGWELQEDGRLHHLQLEAIAHSVQDRFGPQLQVLADAAVVACQGGAGEFDLLPAAEVAKKKRGKHALPKDFEMDKATLARAVSEGYGDEEHLDWVRRAFRDYADAGDRRQANWQATCRNYMASQYTRDTFRAKFGFFPGAAPRSISAMQPGVKSSAAERLRGASSAASQTFAQKASAHNSDSMAAALASRRSRAAVNLQEDDADNESRFECEPGVSA